MSNRAFEAFLKLCWNNNLRSCGIGKKERSKYEQICVPPSVRICMFINIFIYFYVLLVPSYFPTSTNYIYFLVYLFSFCNKIHIYPADCC